MHAAPTYNVRSMAICVLFNAMQLRNNSTKTLNIHQKQYELLYQDTSCSSSNIITGNCKNVTLHIDGDTTNLQISAPSNSGSLSIHVAETTLFNENRINANENANKLDFQCSLSSSQCDENIIYCPSECNINCANCVDTQIYANDANINSVNYQCSTDCTDSKVSDSSTELTMCENGDSEWSLIELSANSDCPTTDEDNNNDPTKNDDLSTAGFEILAFILIGSVIGCLCVIVVTTIICCICWHEHQIKALNSSKAYWDDQPPHNNQYYHQRNGQHPPQKQQQQQYRNQHDPYSRTRTPEPTVSAISTEVTPVPKSVTATSPKQPRRKQHRQQQVSSPKSPQHQRQTNHNTNTIQPGNNGAPNHSSSQYEQQQITVSTDSSSPNPNHHHHKKNRDNLRSPSNHKQTSQSKSPSRSSRNNKRQKSSNTTTSSSNQIIYKQTSHSSQVQKIDENEYKSKSPSAFSPRKIRTNKRRKKISYDESQEAKDTIAPLQNDLIGAHYDDYGQYNKFAGRKQHKEAIKAALEAFPSQISAGTTGTAEMNFVGSNYNDYDAANQQNSYFKEDYEHNPLRAMSSMGTEQTEQLSLGNLDSSATTVTDDSVTTVTSSVNQSNVSPRSGVTGKSRGQYKGYDNHSAFSGHHGQYQGSKVQKRRKNNNKNEVMIMEPKDSGKPKKEQRRERYHANGNDEQFAASPTDDTYTETTEDTSEYAETMSDDVYGQ